MPMTVSSKTLGLIFTENTAITKKSTAVQENSYHYM